MDRWGCVAEAGPTGQDGRVLVKLRNPTRELVVEGPLQVSVLLRRLELNREAVLVIRNDELVAGDTRLDDGDTVEIRPVISGGA